MKNFIQVLLKLMLQLVCLWQLLIGNYGLSYEQSKVQMAVWAILAAPLLISTDLKAIRPEYRDILLNKEIIAINQDKLGIQGRKIMQVFYYYIVCQFFSQL